MLFGLWQHKKGGIYLVLCQSEHSETREPFITYIGLSGIWSRPMTMFLDGRFRPMALESLAAALACLVGLYSIFRLLACLIALL